MDYSKWKKLFYILACISIIVSLSSKVFASYEVEVDSSNTITFPDTFITDTPCFALFITTDNKLCLIRANSTIYMSDSFPSSYQHRYYWTTSPNATGKQALIRNQDTISNMKSAIESNTFTTSLASVEGQIGWTSSTYNYAYSTNLTLLFTNSDIYDFNTNELLYSSDDYLPSNNPHFSNSDSELQTLDFDKIFIDLGDYTINDLLFLKVLEVTNVVEDSNNPLNNVYYYNDLTFKLTNNKNFLHELYDTNTYYYSVPYKALNLKKEKSYYFVLTSSGTQINQTQGEIVENDTIFDVCLCDTSNLITTQDEILNSINNNIPSQNTDNTISGNLPRPNYSSEDNSITIPGMNVDVPQDITTQGFNYIFNMIYSTINPSNNADSAQDIVINIPFVNKELRIDKDLTKNLLGADSPVVALLSTFYYFIVSYYILQDIRKTIEKVKTGDIMTHTDTNIKADML